MELDQDLLNLWLQAKDGLSTEQTRRLVEAMQLARDKLRSLDSCYVEDEEGTEVCFRADIHKLGQWGLDLQTPTSPIGEKLGNYELVYVGRCPGREAWRAQPCS